jgi:hypothetical protein
VDITAAALSMDRARGSTLGPLNLMGVILGGVLTRTSRGAGPPAAASRHRLRRLATAVKWRGRGYVGPVGRYPFEGQASRNRDESVRSRTLRKKASPFRTTPRPPERGGSASSRLARTPGA